MRDLPWRRTRDPWAVLVSEVMLQQTQVPRVEPIWHTFMARFPSVRACADASQAEVVRAWAGLGYNRRAVNLHRAAVLMGDAVPRDLDALLALPGIGAYTARAVLVFAFEEDLGVVDTNIARVLSRRAGRQLSMRELQREADVLVPAGRSWEWNQQLMDLGALVCTARDPSCERCWLRDGCTWDGELWPVRKQSTFAGSDRQGRGRLIAALRDRDVPVGELGSVMGWPDDRPRAERVAAQLVDEGIVEVVQRTTDDTAGQAVIRLTMSS
jgi:A/G-specific adenine glycosylase